MAEELEEKLAKETKLRAAAEDNMKRQIAKARSLERELDKRSMETADAAKQEIRRSSPPATMQHESDNSDLGALTLYSSQGQRNNGKVRSTQGKQADRGKTDRSAARTSPLRGSEKSRRKGKGLTQGDPKGSTSKRLCPC